MIIASILKETLFYKYWIPGSCDFHVTVFGLADAIHDFGVSVGLPEGVNLLVEISRPRPLVGYKNSGNSHYLAVRLIHFAKRGRRHSQVT